jgi:hypothetical protein
MQSPAKQFLISKVIEQAEVEQVICGRRKCCTSRKWTQRLELASF